VRQLFVERKHVHQVTFLYCVAAARRCAVTALFHSLQAVLQRALKCLISKRFWFRTETCLMEATPFLRYFALPAE
jgi:hypothetical protein